MVWIILGIIVVAVAAWLLLRNKDAGTGGHHHVKPHHGDAPAASHVVSAHKPTRKIWGKQLTIPAGAQACQAAHDLEGKGIPHDKVPTLPLAGCSHASCQCHFEPLEDRRSHIERRSGKERREDLRFEPGKTDRRSGTDRRAENANPFALERD